MTTNTKNNLISLLLVAMILMVIGFVGKNLLDREPVKERQQYVVIKSVGVWHKYIVDGKSVIVEYEDVK
jgi:hypothetical protein